MAFLAGKVERISPQLLLHCSAGTSRGAPWHKRTLRTKVRDADTAHANKRFLALAVGCIGVVYGDIGTSPLYAFREAVSATKDAQGLCRDQRHGRAFAGRCGRCSSSSPSNTSSSCCTPTTRVKAAHSLSCRSGQSVAKRSAPLIFALGIIGASFFYGDAVITPAISVLSAVEGLKLVSPALHKFVHALGHHHSGRHFRRAIPWHRHGRQVLRPVHGLLVLRLGLGGLVHIFDNPGVLAAISPHYGLTFLFSTWPHWPDGSRPCLPLRHGCGSALCRPWPFRPQAHPVRLVQLGPARADAQLLRPGRPYPVRPHGPR